MSNLKPNFIGYVPEADYQPAPEDRRKPQKGGPYKSLQYQVGGSHYNSMAIQPAEYCLANMSIEEIRGAMKWNIQRYTWREKENRLEDLKKARHYLDIWIEAEERALI